MKRCELEGCEVEFEPPPDAPHKRFCCAAHRSLYHDRKRVAALRAFAELPVIIDSPIIDSNKVEDEL